MDHLLATKSEGVGLIVRAISFQDSRPMWSQSTNVTDRQTDDMRSQDRTVRGALCTKMHCAIKNGTAHMYNSVTFWSPWVNYGFISSHNCMFLSWVGIRVTATVNGTGILHESLHCIRKRCIKQESCAIAKMTAQCALHMGALKIFGTPWLRPRPLFPIFSEAFVPVDPMNVPTKFEVRSPLRFLENF